ncbi:MAG TPA: hypothetical protein ENN67_03725 [Firmicutes bacterium]|nr:hypothetical protein [Bacillota bacterium]
MFNNLSRSVLFSVVLLVSFYGLGCGSSEILTLNPAGRDASRVKLLFGITARFVPETATVWIGAPPGYAAPSAEVFITLPAQKQIKIRAFTDGSFYHRFPGDENSSVEISWTDRWGQFRTETITVSDPNDKIATGIGKAGIAPNRMYLVDGMVWVVNSGDDEIASYDPETLEPGSMRVSLPVYSNPWEVAFHLESRTGLVTTLFRGVFRFDMQTGEIGRVETSSSPFSPFASPNGVVMLDDTAWVANPNPVSYFPSRFGVGFLSKIEHGISPKVIGEIKTSWVNPQNVITDGKYIYASCTGTVDFMPPYWTPVALTSGGVHVIEPETGEIVASYELGEGGSGPMAITPDRRFLYIGSNIAGWLFRIDLFSGEVLNDASNPIILNNEPVTFIPKLEMLSNGLMICPSFNTDTIHFVDSSTGEVDPFPYSNPIDLRKGKTQAQIYYGVQDVVFCERDGHPGLLVLSSIINEFHWIPLD